MIEHKRNIKIKNRIKKMSHAEYAWHYLEEGDDRKMSCNMFMLLYLARMWFSGLISPREKDELVNRLYYIRQKLFFRDNRKKKNKKPSPPQENSITYAYGYKVITFPAEWDVIEFDEPEKSWHVGVVDVRGECASLIPTCIFFSKIPIMKLTINDIDAITAQCKKKYPAMRNALQSPTRAVGIFEIMDVINYDIPVRIENAKI